MDGPVALVGLGNIGGRIARRLVAAGVPVVGFDLDPDRARAAGAEPSPSPAAAAARARVVLLSLPSSREVEAVVLGDGGVLAGLAAGTVVVDLTTAEPASTRAVAARVEAAGGAFLDAGVSGGAAAAEAGTLTVLVGGDADVLDRVRPLLAHLARTVLHLGPTGAGHTAKAINNFLNGMSLAATAEAMVAGVAAGLDPERLLEAINASSGRTWASEHRFPGIVRGDLGTGGLTSRLQLKDLDVYLALAGSLGIPAPLGEACRAGFADAVDAGYGERISNSIVDAIGDRAGGLRVGPRETTDGG